MISPPPMIDRHRLAFSFKPARLREDLARLAPHEWVPHFNKGFYDGNWSGAVLRGMGGGTDTLLADGRDERGFADTPLLDRCPYFQEVLAAFRCPLRSVRLLRLDADSVVKEHRDYDLGYEHGEVRIHVPVATNPDVEFYLRNRRVVMGEGEVWYLDLGQPHRVTNAGRTPRVHLVLDMQVDDWLRGQVPFETTDGPAAQAVPVLAPAEAARHLESFRDLVRSSVELQAELRDIGDRQLFVEEAQRLGHARGYHFTDREISEAIQQERQRWNEQFVR